MSYNSQKIEKKWQSFWNEQEIYKVTEDSSKPKYYVLDMFPYPSGAGLHVGHPLGYIASDIFSRYKRLKGFNVLHPMGYDAFGLPAEQYAIQTGQHPKITTEKNAAKYRQQMDRIGFSFDWSREFKTCEPSYYKWTQWAFIQLFEHYYDANQQKAAPIAHLVDQFTTNGFDGNDQTDAFTAEEWQQKNNKEQKQILDNFRLAYMAESMVNWCPALGTVLANDEISENFSIRGGHPVEQKRMMQWSLRITAYAERLLEGLNHIDWTESLKEIQRNWIGKSIGAEMTWAIKGHNEGMDIFTTRPDTIFGATYMVLAPEHPLVAAITTEDQKTEVDAYLDAVKSKTERERMTNVKEISGVFTGAFALHPYTQKEIPIWISDYVLMGYGTGAIMAVPAHDGRDWNFAKHFGIPIIQVIEGDISEGPTEAKEGKVINSELINGMSVKKAISHITEDIETKALGKRKVNYRLRDAIFGRQRYWGEPFPVYYRDGIPEMLDIKELPLELPQIDKYLPTEDGHPPLGRADDWQTSNGDPFELSTMPGFAGSSAYFLRYMDPHNEDALVAKDKNDYWRSVDLYVGGKEHATGHLLYSRFWNMFLYDLGIACEEEPFKKLINQGMIQGQSHFVYRVKSTNKFVSHGLRKKFETTPIHVDINLVQNKELNLAGFKAWREEYKDATFELEDGKYVCGQAIEKMSKSLFNVVNPDDVIERYGADTFRLYEMFLGPIEQAKGWDTQGIEGVSRFVKRTWNLFFDESGEPLASQDGASEEELRVLHKTIKKVEEDIENFSLNTAVSAFMICTNELIKLKCHKKEILEKFAVLLAPFAPHVAEEFWHAVGNDSTVLDAPFPKWEQKYLVESTFSCPVSVNGKMKFTLELPLNLSKEELEKSVLATDSVKKLLQDKTLRKVVAVPNKIVNLVIAK